MATSPKERWRRAGSELGIVFLGVFVALLADGWNGHRADRALEEEYLSRLAEDVASDEEGLGVLADALRAKTSALLWLQGLDRAEIEDPENTDLIPEIIRAQAAGFGAVFGVSTTFEDLRSTGHLSLVADSELRAGIVAYYEMWDFNASRVEARRTAFPGDVYGLLPPNSYSTDVYFDSPTSSPVDGVDRSAIADYLLSDRGRTSLRAESNYARFFGGVVQDLLGQARSLLRALGE